MRADKATQTGRILLLPPRSAASRRPTRSWKAPRTRSLERLRYVAHAFQRAGSGGFPAARWWYYQDAPVADFGFENGGARGAAAEYEISWLSVLSTFTDSRGSSQFLVQCIRQKPVLRQRIVKLGRYAKQTARGRRPGNNRNLNPIFCQHAVLKRIQIERRIGWPVIQRVGQWNCGQRANHFGRTRQINSQDFANH